VVPSFPFSTTDVLTRPVGGSKSTSLMLEFICNPYRKDIKALFRAQISDDSARAVEFNLAPKGSARPTRFPSGRG